MRERIESSNNHTRNIYFLFLMAFIYFSNLINSINAQGCFITNRTIILSQWLNNIICLGEKDLKYINFATFSNGDMVVEATANPDSSYRVFYGIKKDGEPLFNDEQYHSRIKISGQSQSNNARYEAEIFIVTIDDKEYLFSIGTGTNKYAELYDLSSKEIKSQVLAKTFLSTNEILNVRGSSTNFTLSGNNFIIFPFLNSGEDLYIKKLSFTSTDISSFNPIKATYSISSKGRSVSCFATESNFIVCFFLHVIQLIWYYYHIGIYDSNLNKKKEICTDYYTVDNSLILKDYPYFSKCIHLEGNIGAFIFYKAKLIIAVYSMETFPTIIFKRIESATSISDYLTPIELNQKEFSSSSLLNDFIKISNTKLCFTSTSTSKENFYIILINIINRNSIVLRYYTLDIFSKYTFKFLQDMRVHLYNNFVAFAFSFCRQSNCESESNPHYAGFMIFSYPNGTDSFLNLTQYIFNNNGINNLVFDLKQNIRIDNNIFGLVYKKIVIKEKNNCDNINIFSNINQDRLIDVNSTLNENEKIKIKLNSYNAFNCLISYKYIITEPDFTKYNSYAERDTSYGQDTSDIFNESKNDYESRVLDYYIILDENLGTQCTNKNCEICLESNKEFCLICKFNNYTININGNNKNKVCYPNSTNLEIFETSEIEKKTTQLIEEQTTELTIESTIT